MSGKEIKAFEIALIKQRKVNIRSKKAAKKFLMDLGIYELLVPKGTNQMTVINPIA